ncbi:hypothetical protein MXB_4997 [Myxobolus squamalis]|nr:hypothetical protein MXB_4997 [Myxobolus squamalis]
MPKNKGKGGKNRRRGKNENDRYKRELLLKEEGQEYAQVTKILGNGYVEAICFDGVKRTCHIRGKMRKKKEKCDIIAKYTSDEAKMLKACDELPDSVKLLETTGIAHNMEDHDVSFDLRPVDDEEQVPQQKDRYTMMPDSDEYDEEEEEDKEDNSEKSDENEDEESDQ